MGLTSYLDLHQSSVRLHGCEPYNYPKYARFSHARSATIADGLILETPHPAVQERIRTSGTTIHLVEEPAIRRAMRELYEKHALIVEPSSAIAVGLVQTHQLDLEEPICVVLTGGNVAREDFDSLIAGPKRGQDP
jgi:threonine dehydratase